MSRKIKVLLADDHTILREATAGLVDHQPDMQVVGRAGTGQDTLESIAVLRPDVVVTNISMPRIDGLQVTSNIVTNYSETKVLVLSAHQEGEHVISLLRTGRPVIYTKR